MVIKGDDVINIHLMTKNTSFTTNYLFFA